MLEFIRVLLIIGGYLAIGFIVLVLISILILSLMETFLRG